MWGMRSKEECTVKSVFEASIVSTLEAILWLLILGLRCDQGCKDNPGPPFIGDWTWHKYELLSSLHYSKKNGQVSFFPSLPPSLMGRWVTFRAGKGVWPLQVAEYISLKSQSPDILLLLN